MNNKSAVSLFAIGLSSLIISGCVSEGGSYESRPPSAYRERVIIDRSDDYRPHRRPGFDRDDNRDARFDRDRGRNDNRGDARHKRDDVRHDRDRDKRPDGRRCEGPRCPEEDGDNRRARTPF